MPQTGAKKRQIQKLKRQIAKIQPALDKISDENVIKSIRDDREGNRERKR